MARAQLDKAEREYNLEKAAELRHGTIPGIEKKLAEAEAAIKNSSANRLLKEEVDEEDIAAIISRWTHIPVSKLVQSEKEKLLKLADRLHERVVGQDEEFDRATLPLHAVGEDAARCDGVVAFGAGVK